MEDFEAERRFDVKLCIVGRFINEGVVDFTAMEQTLASLWN